MPDWQEIARRHLSGISPQDSASAETIAEIASHLEEAYEAFLRAGLATHVAQHRALAEVNDWQDLLKKLISSRKESSMNDRVKQFWLPALFTLFAAQLFLMIFQFVGPKPFVSPLWSGPPRVTPLAVVYIAWLITLPFIGAFGAFLAKRAGAGPKAVFSAVTFPVFPFLAFVLVGLPIALLLDDRVAHNITLPAFLVGASAWVVFPAIALISGAAILNRFRPGGDPLRSQ